MHTHGARESVLHPQAQTLSDLSQHQDQLECVLLRYMHARPCPLAHIRRDKHCDGASATQRVSRSDKRAAQNDEHRHKLCASSVTFAEAIAAVCWQLQLGDRHVIEDSLMFHETVVMCNYMYTHITRGMQPAQICDSSTTQSSWCHAHLKRHSTFIPNAGQQQLSNATLLVIRRRLPETILGLRFT